MSQITSLQEDYVKQERREGAEKHWGQGRANKVM